MEKQTIASVLGAIAIIALISTTFILTSNDENLCDIDVRENQIFVIEVNLGIGIPSEKGYDEEIRVTSVRGDNVAYSHGMMNETMNKNSNSVNLGISL